MSLDDLDRPLSKRGKREALLLGQLLMKIGLVPQLVISSYAKRARKTAIKITQEINYPKEEIYLSEIIYNGNLSEIIELIRSINNKIDFAIIIGHFPSLLELGNCFTGSHFKKFSTSGFILIGFKDNSWKNVAKNNGNIICIERVR